MLLSKLVLGTVRWLFPSDMPNKPSSWPDWHYPSWRDQGCQLNAEGWLEGKRQLDGAEGLWRVHDGLYDLSTWVHSHPGGPDWLSNTKGTDVTEAFEAHHLAPTANKILKTFYVRDAKTPRNSPFTFKPDGFYRVLKGRVYEALKDVKPGPSSHSKRLLESLVVGALTFSVLAAMHCSFLCGTIAGISLALATVCAHNFFHMRDNWRMYLFNLSLLTVRNWRITHALSHHLMPNTHYDMEISMFEPFLKYLPTSDKANLFSTTRALLSPIIYPFVLFGEAVIRTLSGPVYAEDLIGVFLPTLMIVGSGGPLLTSLLMWVYVMMVTSFVFISLGLNAAHHHPDIFHYGDRPRDDRDWGLHTMDATRDRVEVCGSTNLVLLTFGDHTLHHLFPSVDHVHLSTLYPVLEKTCKEFGIDFKLCTTYDLIVGQFKQLMRNKPNLNERSCSY